MDFHGIDLAKLTENEQMQFFALYAKARGYDAQALFDTLVEVCQEAEPPQPGEKADTAKLCALAFERYKARRPAQKGGKHAEPG